MALGTIAAIAGGVGAAANAAKGLAGSAPKTDTKTQQTTFGAKTPQQQQLEAQSMQNYLQQQNLAGQYEGQIGSAQGLQDQARAQASNVLGGQAFNISPQELSQIQGLRSATVAQGQAEAQNFLEQGSRAATQSAAMRGLRGQAGAQLQGDVLRAASERLGQSQRQADIIAAQQQMDAPYKRIAAQQPLISSGMSFADQMRLQAQNNRIAAQNPFLLQQAQTERLQGGMTTLTGTQAGEPGSLGSGISGAFAGAGQGIKGVSDIASGIRNIGATAPQPQ